MSSNIFNLPAPIFCAESRKDGVCNMDQLEFEVLSRYVMNENQGDDTLDNFNLLGKSNNDSSQIFKSEACQSTSNLPMASTKANSGEQAERRRERNRLLARKTRLRKKMFFESLQKRVRDLKKENELLKEIAKRRLEESEAAAILAECHSELPKIVTENIEQATEVLTKSDFTLMKLLTESQKSFCITDPTTPDNPIVYASKQFLDLTGYSQQEVIGRNCRFLQGPDTDPAKVDLIRKGIQEGKDTSVCILNYKKDGTTFWNKFFISALHDASGKIVNFVGVQCAVPQQIEGYESD